MDTIYLAQLRGWCVISSLNYVEGGPGWRIRSIDLRPEITDLEAFRSGLRGDPLLDAIEALWGGDPTGALSLLVDQPDSFRVRALRADCRRDLGDHDVAVAEYDLLVEAVAGSPREAVIRQHRGKALLAAGRSGEAVEDFERVVDLRDGGDPALLASAVQALEAARASAGGC